MLNQTTSGSVAQTTHADSDACALCGLDIGRARVSAEVGGRPVQFCCAGCSNVFQILFNDPAGPPCDFRNTELFRACVESGLIPAGAAAIKDATLPAEQVQTTGSSSSSAQADAKLAQEITLSVRGMWCFACGWLVEEQLRRTKGVVSASVFFLADTARVRYLPWVTTPQEISRRVETLGYGSGTAGSSEGSGQKRDLGVRLGVSAILSMNVMMISFALYAGFFEDIGREGVAAFSWPLWVLSTPVVAWGGYPLFKRAILGLRYLTTSMDTLIGIGVLSSYIYSVVMMLRGSPHVYFDTAAMLVTLSLLGRLIEMNAREKVSSGILELYGVLGGKVRLVHEDRERWVSPAAVRKGALFKVLEGERIPADGRLMTGACTVDESIVTGESRPVWKSPGGEVSGGTLLLEGNGLFEATRGGEEGSLNDIISLIQEALSRKNRFEMLADRVTRWLVPAILLLASTTAGLLLLYGASFEDSLLRAVTVLVITCPCALGIAVPLAKVAAIGTGRSHGVLIRDPAALEQCRDLDTIIFDKTGTLTTGLYALQAVNAKGLNIDLATTQGRVGLGTAPTIESDILRVAAGLEAHSDHFIAGAIVRRTRDLGLEPIPVQNLENYEGMGISGQNSLGTVAAGNRKLMNHLGIFIPVDLERQAKNYEDSGMTVVFLSVSSRVESMFVLGDRLKEGARSVVQDLRDRGIDVQLVSGDSAETVGSIAAALGIDRYIGQASPADKVAIVAGLKGQGRKVGMVGDGINDAAALAAADVGFAIGVGSNIAREASDVTLPGDDPRNLITALDLSEATVRISRANLLLAMFYNGLAVPLAVAGVLTPIIAATAMFASSTTVILNTLRISRGTYGYGSREKNGVPKILPVNSGGYPGTNP